LSKHQKDTESKFNRVKFLLDKTLNDNSVQSHLNDFGYTAEKLHEGEMLFKEAFELYKNNFIAHKLENPDDFHTLWNNAYEYYLQLIHISRFALQNERTEFIQLGLAGPRKTSLSGWLSQANQFYINVLSNPDICEKLSEYGITKEKLEKGKKQLDTVEVTIVSRNTGSGDTRKLSLEYDRALDSMEDWFTRFNTVSRIIFENKPQFLNKLQINHR
jgi:hypothetical protein